MNKNQTIEKMRNMRLNAMASMYQHHLQNNLYSDSTPDEYVSLLTDHEWEERQNTKIQRLIKQAGFRQKATIVEVDFISPEARQETWKRICLTGYHRWIL